MKIVLVRHGYSQGNLEKKYTGFTDVKLTDEGIAELIRFKDEYHYPKTDRYISSTLVRCLDTFQYLFGDEEELYETSDALRELYFGDYEDRFAPTLLPHYFDEFHLNVRTANGETISEFMYRLVTKLVLILQDLKRDNLNSATIICHSGVIKTLLLFLESRPFTDFGSIETQNGLGYILDLDFDENTNMVKLKEIEPIGLKK